MVDTLANILLVHVVINFIAYVIVYMNVNFYVTHQYTVIIVFN